MKKILLSLSLLMSFLAYSQNPPCATDAVMDNVAKNSPAAKQKMDAFDRQMFMNKSSGATFTAPPPGSITIPVVVYVVSDGAGTVTDISDQQVNDQLTALNGYYLNTGITFCLATKAGGTTTTIPTNSGDTHDPLFPGIVHVTNTTLTNYSTSGSQQPFLNTAHAAITADRYLRIWVVKSINGASSGILGYAPLPNSGLELDGVVIRYDVFGNGSANLLANYNQGKALVHEVGHYLNLWHTFQGGCSQTDCQFDGDKVCDTPPVNLPNFGCVAMTNSCYESPQVYDLIHNYMDYGNNVCVNSFSDGQIERMVGSVNLERSMLISSYWDMWLKQHYSVNYR